MVHNGIVGSMADCNPEGHLSHWPGHPPELPRALSEPETNLELSGFVLRNGDFTPASCAQI